MKRALLLFVIGLVSAEVVYRERNVIAAGKKAPATTEPQACAVPTNPLKQPLRAVVLKPIATKPFMLPNGATVDLNSDLQAMLATATTDTMVFSPSDPLTQAPGVCDEHLEIRAAVSTLELNAFEFGLSFGYTPSGSDSVITNLTGQTKVRIGTIAMEFGVWNCLGARCTEIIAASSSHATAGVDVQVNIDFGMVKTGPALARAPAASIRSLLTEQLSMWMGFRASLRLTSLLTAHVGFCRVISCV